MSWPVWLGFLLAALVIAVTPGPGAIASMSTGLRQGYGPALRLILGLQAALLVQIGVVALGLGALLAASETAFNVVRTLGAIYLIWLGIEKWRAPVGAAATPPPLPAGGLFLQGLLVNLTNPKAIVFICALVPPFVDPATPQVPQYLTIAATLCATDIAVMSCYALAAVRVGRWLDDPPAQRLQNRLFASLFVAAGTLLALSQRPR